MSVSFPLRNFRPVGMGWATLVLVLASLGGIVQPAGAALVLTEVTGSATASADFFGTSFPPSATDSESFGPFGGAAVAEVGRTRAVQTGSGLNAVNAEGVFDDVPDFALRAETFIDQRVSNTGAIPKALAFQYVINGGELRLFSPRGSFEGLEATVGVSIFVLAPDFSGFLWEWGATLRGTGGSAVAEVHGFAPIFDLVDPLDLGMPDLSAVTVAGSEAVLSIAPFTGFADLGVMGAGANSVITYSMYGSVSGPALNGGGGEASLGDPFDFTGNPGSAISIPGALPVPEPESWVVVLLGLAALLATAGGRRSSAERPL
jgi:hypothetical protein